MLSTIAILDAVSSGQTRCCQSHAEAYAKSSLDQILDERNRMK